MIFQVKNLLNDTSEAFFLVIFVLVPLSSPCVSSSFAVTSNVILGGWEEPSLSQGSFWIECWFSWVVVWEGAKSPVRSSGVWYSSAIWLSEGFLTIFSSWICQISGAWRNYTEHLRAGAVVGKSGVKLQHLSKACKCWVVSSSGSASLGAQRNVHGVFPALSSALQSCIHWPEGSGYSWGIPGWCWPALQCWDALNSSPLALPRLLQLLLGTLPFPEQEAVTGGRLDFFFTCLFFWPWKVLPPEQQGTIPSVPLFLSLTFFSWLLPLRS